ncbi:MAG: radical SAM/SPASM domain-containing protein [Candidatus Hodarchaeales archaeon]
MYDEPNSTFLHGGMSSEAAIQKKYFEEGMVYTIQIESTLKCSQGCSYCYAESTPSSPNILESKDIYHILEEAKQLKVRCIDWLGGDPLVRQDWYDLMLYAQNIGLINNIWTSGIPLQNKTIANKAVKVTQNGGFISIHLDSLNPDVYKKVHNSKVDQNINAILEGLNNILTLGKDASEIWNCITLTKPIAEADVYETMDWFWTKKKIRTVLTLYNPVASTDPREILIPSKELIQKAYKGRDKIMYNNELSFSTMDVSKFYCGSMICITNEGFYTPCSVIRTKEFGNYKDLNLTQLVETNPGDILMRQFQNPDNLPEPCQNCDQNEICYGCRSSAFYFSGDMFGCDPKCPKCSN